MHPSDLPSLKTILRPFRPPCLLPRQRRTLWAQPHMVAPALVKKRFGNGKRLIGLLPIMHRPKYYLVWIDDRWDLENSQEWFDQLDGIWEQISNEFGSRPEADTGPYRWPEEDSRDGCSWFVADAFDVLPKRRLAALRRKHATAR